MSNILQLKEASIHDGKAIFDLHNSIGKEDSGFTNPSFGLSYEEFKDYLQTLVSHAKGIDLPDGYVPQTTFWLSKDNHPIGISRLRHCLTDSLKIEGGHIGYYIHPQNRSRGFGNLLLELTLAKAREMSIGPVLLTCRIGNIASRKIIENNHGILENENSEKDTCYYWIDLSS